ncbi:MAG: hypothetical protein HCA25_18855 [Dolichospermum sp. DET50]|nr:hypothetical protein [Dolichospermum sp. DET66]MBS3034268.1 hypothetical protein [Dolichospermum sp. DET67]MBS3039471.1 hypothetical protein [Dolichospermum sp. DET50]QSX70724.1 MAG: hypothetical protein EZY12_18125 [Dolichospermum sp. DET69]
MKWIFISILIICLTACTSLALLPTPELVQKAIALQLEQTQQQLNQQLDLNFQKFNIQRISITQEQPLTIENLPAYRVQGNYDFTVKLPKRSFKQVQKPFEVYLQIQKEGKSWRLLVPEKNRQDSQSKWHSYLIL